MAITILITKDPGIKGGFLDSAAALTVAVEQAKSKHNITLIALIHKDVTKCVPVLKALGYQIRAYDVSILFILAQLCGMHRVNCFVLFFFLQSAINDKYIMQ